MPKGLEIAANTIEATYTTPVQTHVSLETHGAVASFNAAGDQLTVWCSTQGVFSVRDDLAVYFNLPPDSVRVVCEYLGGGFGSKFGATPEIIIAARLAKAAGVPVKVMLPRARRASLDRQSAELGAESEDGRRSRRQTHRDRSGDSAAAAESAAARAASGPFKSVYPMREYPHSGNQHLYQRRPVVADARARMAAGMLRAGARDGRDGAQGRRSIGSNSAAATVTTRCARAEYEIGARAFGWAEKNERREKIQRTDSSAASASRRAEWHAVGASGPEAQVIAHRDGSVEVRVGTQDIGTGTRTVLAIVAAEELGLPVARVKSEIGDTRFLFSVP